MHAIILAVALGAAPQMAGPPQAATPLATAPTAPLSTADESSPMAGAFGNTMVSEQPDGTVTRTYIDPDGRYRSVTNGAETSGTWEVKKGRICYNAVGAPPLCALGPNKKVGSKWTIFLSDDAKVKVSIQPGRP